MRRVLNALLLVVVLSLPHPALGQDVKHHARNADLQHPEQIRSRHRELPQEH